MRELQGTITEVVFRNEENGYTVAELETGEDLITVVGNLPEVHQGSKYLLRGEMKKHAVYGEQFAFKEFEEMLPVTVEGIQDFLASGVIKGIGFKTAKAVVQKFGAETLKVMEETPERLLEVPGIGPKSLLKIKDSFQDQRAFAQVSMFFTQNGLSVAQALRMYQVYGRETITILKENPYRLVDEVAGIGFRKADAIANLLGVSEDSEFRIRSAVKYLLSRHVADGDTCYPLTELEEEAADLLDLQRKQIFEVLGAMAFEGEVKLDRLNEVDFVYLVPYYRAETMTTSRILEVASSEVHALTADLDSCIRISEEETGKQLSEEQKEAVKQSLQSGMSVITGGPGTGKTTVLSALLSILRYSDLKVLLAAPTGRAAKRITETTGAFASTMHRMLEYSHDEDSGKMVFGKNAEDPLEADCIIVDEASMIDLMLMYALMDAVPNGCRVILVGDVDQLPSVGAGNVLRDIMDSGLVPVSRLQTIFRQAGESRIVVNAHRINHGEALEVNGTDSDFFFLPENSEKKMQALIPDLVKRRLPAYYENLDPLKDIQVLTPVHRGSVGTEQLNGLLQETFNPPAPEKAEKKWGSIIFREGDKVMQIKNDYSLTWTRPGVSEEQFGIFNGDMGILHRIDKDNGTATVIFDDDRYVQYDNQQMEELTLAYAITVHKSQGSEFPVVVMPVSYFPPMLASRNLLYTAVTRGKRLVVLVGSYSMMNRMIANNRISMRHSGLAQRLADMVPLRDGDGVPGAQ